MSFEKLAERQILKAQAEGQLEGLMGEGERLPEDTPGDPAAKAGFRIMAAAGALPREIELKKAIAEQRSVLSSATGVERKTAMRHLAELEQRLAIEAEARRKFYRTS